MSLEEGGDLGQEHFPKFRQLPFTNPTDPQELGVCRGIESRHLP